MALGGGFERHIRTQFQKHKDNVSAVAASKDGQVIVSGGWDGKVIVWDIRTGAALRECRVRISPLSLFLGQSGILIYSVLRATPRVSLA